MSKKKRNLIKRAQNDPAQPNKNEVAVVVTERAQMPELKFCLTCKRLPPIGDIDDWLRISPSASLRLKRFFMGFAEGFIVALMVLLALYLPDYIADYSHRSESFLAFFKTFFILATIFIGICAAISVLIKDNVLYISPSRRCIYQGRSMNTKKAKDAVSLDIIDSLAIEPPSPIIRRSRLIANVNGNMSILAETLGNNDDLVTLLRWLKDLKQ